MRPAAVALMVLVGILLAPLGIRMVDKMKVSHVTVNPSYQKQDLPPQTDPLTMETPKTVDVAKTITLEEKNMVVLRGPVTPSSVSEVMNKLQTVSRAVSKNTPIYLVLDTPGGSISDGLDLIDFASALPQKVHTVTLFAASMGFQIAQNLNTRYIIRNGTLMSHRASVSGLSGQVKGELEARYKMIRRMVDFLDVKASTRMGMTLKEYEALVVPEYWVHGYDAVAAKIADEQVLLQCGSTLNGSDQVSFNTIFGTVIVTFSKCPLIKAPEKIDVSSILDGDKEDVKQLFGLALEDKPRFIREYITTDKFFEVFR